MNFMVGRITVSSILLPPNALLYQYLDIPPWCNASGLSYTEDNMFRAFLRCIPVAGIATGLLLADFSYEQTSNITGGMVAGMMKVAGVFSRQAREPIHTTVAIKGDRMLSGNERHAEIIDLDKETFTTIDFQKKTWSVMTFAEMKQMMEDVSQKMKSNHKGEVHFKVSANATGQTRQISGVVAKEMIMKM